MYEMMKSLEYKINILKILEYKHTNFMKPYIDFCFEKKTYYKSIGDKNMSLTFKNVNEFIIWGNDNSGSKL